MLFERDDSIINHANIKVVGIGGAGGNAIDRMMADGLDGVEFIAVNTDAQALEFSHADVKLQIGKQLTNGLGAGAQLHVGTAAAMEDAQTIEAALDGADLVFITAGMGGGTGTGAASEIAGIARGQGALTVGIVTMPFRFEGTKRAARALQGIEWLRKEVDTLIVIENDRLMNLVEKQTTMQDAFRLADSTLHGAVRGIADLISVHGLINLDFADVRTVMQGMGEAIMGTGQAKGEEAASIATEMAINSPLIDATSIYGAQGVLVNVTGGPDLSLASVHEATSLIYHEVGDEANIIFGAIIDPDMKDEIRVTVIATGFGPHKALSLDKEERSLARNMSPAEPIIERRQDETPEEPQGKPSEESHEEPGEKVYTPQPAYLRRKL